MQVVTTSLHDVKLIRLGRFEDKRGYFCEIYNARTLADRGISEMFVQDNESYSRNKGTIRGLHFQLRPFAQAKLVRVLRGSILDVVVDLRTDSPGFGRHIAIPLTPHALEQIYIPAGFAHGFCTLEPDTVVSYKVSAPYSPEHDRGVAWNDPDLAIDWPVRPADAILSDKDRQLPRLRDLPAHFTCATS